MILQDDGPYEAQDDGRFTIHNIRNVNVDEFDLRRKQHIINSTSQNQMSGAAFYTGL